MGRHNDRNIKEVLYEFISTNKKVSKGYHTAHIEEIWKNEMGPIIAGYTQKMYFNNGTLTVYLHSAPLKKELLMGKDKIMKILNDAAQTELITKIDIY